MNVAEHRPVLRRIEIGQRAEVDKRRDITEALSGISPTERDRIWRLVEQTARGVNAPDEPASVDELVKQYLDGEL
jgi:hypothetical protein